MIRRPRSFHPESREPELTARHDAIEPHPRRAIHGERVSEPPTRLRESISIAREISRKHRAEPWRIQVAGDDDRALLFVGELADGFELLGAKRRVAQKRSDVLAFE